MNAVCQAELKGKPLYVQTYPEYDARHDRYVKVGPLSNIMCWNRIDRMLGLKK